MYALFLLQTNAIPVIRKIHDGKKITIGSHNIFKDKWGMNGSSTVENKQSYRKHYGFYF